MNYLTCIVTLTTLYSFYRAVLMVCHNVNDITKMFCETSDNINYCTVDLRVYKFSCMQINLASLYVSVDLYSD